MRKLMTLVVLIHVCVSVVVAQTEEPKVEIFAGFSSIATQSRITNKDIRTIEGITPDQFRTLFGFDLASNDRFFATAGFEASATRYFSKRVGLEGDFSGYYHRETTRIADTFFGTRSSIYTILGGPHVRFVNKSRFTPFIHALVGAARVRTSYRESESPSPLTVNDASTRLAMAFGGGLDLRVSKRVAIRLFQLDYSPILGKDRTVTASDGTVIELNGRAQEKNLRLSIGIVFR